MPFSRSKKERVQFVFPIFMPQQSLHPRPEYGNLVPGEPHLLPGCLVCLRGPYGQQVSASVHIGVVLLVVLSEGLHNGARLLGGGGAVEVNQRLTRVRLLGRMVDWLVGLLIDRWSVP